MQKLKQRKTLLICCEGQTDLQVIQYCLKVITESRKNSKPAVAYKFNYENLKGGMPKALFIKLSKQPIFEIVDRLVVVLDNDSPDTQELEELKKKVIAKRPGNLVSDFIIWNRCVEAELLNVLDKKSPNYSKHNTKFCKRELKKRYPDYFKKKESINRNFLEKNLNNSNLKAFLAKPILQPLWDICT